MLKHIEVLFVIFLLFIGCETTSHYKNNKPIKIDISEESVVMESSYSDSLNKTINVAISTMISPKKTFFLYEKLLNYIEKKLGVHIQLKQRKTYQEVNDMLKEGSLDFAYVCSGAYVVGRREFPMGILAAPKINGKTYYQAYIITNKNSSLKSFSNLKGKSFAFSDPLSNTGYKYVIDLLKKRGYTSDIYFSKTIFTYAHDYSIQAVARNLVDGATVDGLVYDYLAIKEPERVKKIRVIQKSPQFGIPPFVYSPSADKKLIQKVQNILVNMDKDEDGKKILSDLQIESFEIVKPDIYNSIESFN